MGRTTLTKVLVLVFMRGLKQQIVACSLRRHAAVQRCALHTHLRVCCKCALLTRHMPKLLLQPLQGSSGVLSQR
jgi:hypothetical protein